MRDGDGRRDKTHPRVIHLFTGIIVETITIILVSLDQAMIVEMRITLELNPCLGGALAHGRSSTGSRTGRRVQPTLLEDRLGSFCYILCTIAIP